MAQILESLSVVFPSPIGDDMALYLWCIFLGAVLVFVSTYLRAKREGKILETLLEAECHGEDEALPIPEGKVPSCVKSVDVEGVRHLYLPEENVKKAEAVLKSASAPVWLCLLELLALYVLLLALYYLLPLILELF